MNEDETDFTPRPWTLLVKMPEEETLTLGLARELGDDYVVTERSLEVSQIKDRAGNLVVTCTFPQTQLRTRIRFSRGGIGESGTRACPTRVLQERGHQIVSVREAGDTLVCETAFDAQESMDAVVEETRWLSDVLERFNGNGEGRGEG